MNLFSNGSDVLTYADSILIRSQPTRSATLYGAGSRLLISRGPRSHRLYGICGSESLRSVLFYVIVFNNLTIDLCLQNFVVLVTTEEFLLAPSSSHHHPAELRAEGGDQAS